MLKEHASAKKATKKNALEEAVSVIGKNLKEVGFDTVSNNSFIFQDEELGVRTTVTIGITHSIIKTDWRIDTSDDTWESYWSSADELSIQCKNDVVVEKAVEATKRMIDGKHPFEEWDCVICELDEDDLDDLI